MLDRVVGTIRRYRMFEPGQCVGVAVSGGADSLCLLHVLKELGPRWDLRLSVIHLNHQLRGEESRQDAGFVAEAARKMGLPCHVHELDVHRGDNLEQAAREARQRFYRQFLDSGAVERIAVGHTRSDQAETVLFRFLRGAGTAGLAGIRPVTKYGVVRPLLAITREETEAYLKDRNIRWREDSTNASLRFARNRLRHKLLPALTADWNPNLSATLSDMADWALEEEAYWEAEMDRISALHLAGRPPVVLMRADTLARLPAAVARRLVRRALQRSKGDLLSIDFQHVEAVVALAASPQGTCRLQVPGVDVLRSFDWIRLAPPSGYAEDRDFRAYPIPPAQITLPGGLRLDIQVVRPESGYTGRMSDLDWDRVSSPLEVRNWQPGDLYQPVGSTRPQKLKALFQQVRIPIWERRHWTVVTGGGAIVWTRRFGPSREAAATKGSHMLLRIRETDNVES